MRTAVLWAILGLNFFSALLSVAAVGKPRDPITPRLAAATVGLVAPICWAIYWLATTAPG